LIFLAEAIDGARPWFSIQEISKAGPDSASLRKETQAKGLNDFT